MKKHGPPKDKVRRAKMMGVTGNLMFCQQSMGDGGQHSTMVIVLASGPGFDSQCSQIFFMCQIVDVAVEVNQRRCLEECGQWLENVNPTHLVLASGKLDYKKFPIPIWPQLQVEQMDSYSTGCTVPGKVLVYPK